MDRQLLSSGELEKILAKLSPEDAQKVLDHQESLLEASRRFAGLAIMVRNLSHNLGRHFLS